MEPMVIFSVGLVVFCGYIALMDAARDWRRNRVNAKHTGDLKSSARSSRRRVTFSAARREGGVDARWPGPLTGSV